MANDEVPPSKPVLLHHRVLKEVGLSTLYHAPTDVKLLALQRFVRLFAYGASTIVLVPYLSELGISDQDIGLFMTLTLAGDVFISFGLTLVADSLGRRRILALGALLMCLSGVIFAIFGNYWILLAAAIFGVITPSGNEIGPFRAVEESTIAHLTAAIDRGQTFAWYALVGTAGSSLGLMTGGWVTTALIDRNEWTPIEAYRLVFFGYATIGVAKLLLTFVLSSKCEPDKPAPDPAGPSETDPLLSNGGAAPKKSKRKSLLALLPTLSPQSRIVLINLSLLFAFDNFASGLAPLSWVTYYFRTRFALSGGTVGTLFFITSMISAVSILFAAALARRIGNVKTMVFTHLPSSICLGLIGIPSQLWMVMTLVVIRSCTQSMDSGPRSAFLAAIVLPNERTVTMGIINIVKTFSQSLGPLVTGALYERKLYWVAFLAAGTLKVTYDLGMLAMFASYRTREDQEADEESERQSVQN